MVPGLRTAGRDVHDNTPSWSKEEQEAMDDELSDSNSSTDSVTADVFPTYDDGDSSGSSSNTRPGKHAKNSIEPLQPSSLFAPNYRPLGRAISANSSNQPAQNGQNDSRLSPSNVMQAYAASEKTPTARHFKIAQTSPVSSLDTATPRSVLNDMISPTSTQYAESDLDPQAVLASPWDNPIYSQPPSPERSVHDYGLVPHTASPAGDRDRRRPRLGEHRSSASISWSSSSSSSTSSGGIQKRSSVHANNANKRNSQARLSGNFSTPPSTAPLLYNDSESVPLWQKQQQQQLAGSSGLSRKNSQRVSKSRRTSRNFEGGAELETPPTSAHTAKSVSSSTASISHSDGADFSAAGKRNSLHDAGSFALPSHPRERETHNHNDHLPDDAQSHIFSLDPLLRALTPASAPPMSLVQSVQNPALSAWDSSATTSTDNSPRIATLHLTGGSSSSQNPKAPVTPLAPMSGANQPQSPKSVPNSHYRAGSLRRSARRTSKSGFLLAESAETNKIPDHAKAKAIEPHALLDRLKDAHNGFAEKLFILDVRALHNFVGETAGRIRSSINVNFPSLLVKRFRKGNTASFALESFITTQNGRQVYDGFCPEGDFLSCFRHFDVCIIDEHITDKDFANITTTGSVGSVLVTVLEKIRKSAGPSSPNMGQLWYLQGSLSTFIQAAGNDSHIVAYALDGSDGVSSSAQAVSPTDRLSTPKATLPKFPHSTSDDSLLKISSFKQKARSLPHLSLPFSSSVPRLLQSTASKPPASPGLFRSVSESHAPQQAPKAKARPIHLQKLDTSVKQLSGVRRMEKRASPPASLAPPKSFQEVCMAQAATPTKASFASAAGAGPINTSNLAYGSDDYQSGPPPTPGYGGFSHTRNISTDSNASTASSTSQYPSFQSNGLSESSVPRNSFRQVPATAQKAVVPFDASVIIPGFLYLGPEPVKLTDVQELESVGIKRILNMAIECDTQERWKGRFEKIATIPMRDSLAEVNVQDRIREACILLDDADLHSKPTYVHCKAGKSRSVTIVLAYLIHRNHWSLKKAYAHVTERRKGVSPNIGFVAELMRFEESELGSRSQGVLGDGATPSKEQDRGPRNGFFRTHSKTLSAASNSSASSASTNDTANNGDASSTYSESTAPTSVTGRPTIVRHLSLIANTAMNLTADQASSKSVKDAKAAARNARVRESLPPGVGFAGLILDKESSDPVEDK